MKKICFDLDGVICNNTYGNYDSAKPFFNAINKINELYENGFIIIIFTARYMGMSNGDIKRANTLGFEQAKKQLDTWGVKYHELKLGKPEYDMIVDDKGYGYNISWIKDLNKSFSI